MNIFTITLINSAVKDAISTKDSFRCIGFYYQELDAVTAVETNKGEMHECLYNYLVIEEIPDGVWRSTISEKWYEWSYRQKWEQCQKPAQYRQVCNISGFGIG